VATAVGGIPEIIVPGETGLLIEPGDVDGLAAAAIALLGDPALAAQLGDAARRRVTEEFSAPRWMARLRAVYDEVLGIG
jgi:glycosyltransferase involved in cell wall biosynthesis